MQSSHKSLVEVSAIIGVYVLFLLIGLYSGQTTMTINIISPADRTQLQSSPVEIVTRVTVKGVPVPDVKMKFTLHFGESDESSFDAVSDTRGIARLALPLESVNCTWQVTAVKEGYPTIVSRVNTFSIKLALLVYALLPSANRVSISPVSFTARVTDLEKHLVPSANVTFYVDSAIIGSNLTTTNGIARLSSTVDPGWHTWFASANNGGRGGISDPTRFLVGQPSSLPEGSDDCFYGSRCTGLDWRNPRTELTRGLAWPDHAGLVIAARRSSRFGGRPCSKVPMTAMIAI